MHQKAKFEQMGIKAEFVGGAQDNQGVVAEVIAGRIQLLFISPESILNNGLCSEVCWYQTSTRISWWQ